MRLIDADEVLKLIKARYECPEICKREIDAIPAIDPVKHGKWIFKGTSTDGKKVYECSACHADIYATGNFCKECGARMDGEV